MRIELGEQNFLPLLTRQSLNSFLSLKSKIWKTVCPSAFQNDYYMCDSAIVLHTNFYTITNFYIVMNGSELATKMASILCSASCPLSDLGNIENILIAPKEHSPK